MKATCQHRIIAQYLHTSYGHFPEWPFSSAAELEGELSRKNLELVDGEFLVVSLGRNGPLCGKASGLEEFAAFSAESVVIPYHDLERALHEQYADYVEL